MAKGQWVGVNGVARKVKTKYVGVSGVARKIKAGWVGVSGVARQYFSSGISYTFVEGKGTASEITSQTVSAGVSGSNWYFSVTATLSTYVSGGQPCAYVEINDTTMAGKRLAIEYQTKSVIIRTGAFVCFWDASGAIIASYDISGGTSKSYIIPTGTVKIWIGVEDHASGTETRTLTISSLTIGDEKLV